ncbi:hypothetical protein GV828_10915 [Flavobacterium sp. NST-5]|uniref:YchJ-like middle NTF2-like domain-containing protein n=1 Tax=Flavobacterium ichthyis TaxID=2698827 RepID=A0ABW9ZC86_9FLAO|nr:YchJ family metal-binding protein [Flavobacterium ichthyis]NBL65711.1 hypothetical protein [Flavobacterium ichthyis]
MPDCYCGSTISIENCCLPFIENLRVPATAEQLMRSRYVAYVLKNADYLIETTHIQTRNFHHKKDILEWANSTYWLKLEIINFSNTSVEFKAYYLNNQLFTNVHHEKSNFLFQDGKWFYVDGQIF